MSARTTPLTTQFFFKQSSTHSFFFWGEGGGLVSKNMPKHELFHLHRVSLAFLKGRALWLPGSQEAPRKLEISSNILTQAWGCFTRHFFLLFLVDFGYFQEQHPCLHRGEGGKRCIHISLYNGSI